MDWTKLYTKHKGKWVALKDDEVTVIASAKTAKEVLEISMKKGFKNPILNRIPDKMVAFVGSF